MSSFFTACYKLYKVGGKRFGFSKSNGNLCTGEVRISETKCVFMSTSYQLSTAHW